MGAENETGKGDYVGYLAKEGGIQLVGPMSRQEAVNLATEIKNMQDTVAIRVHAKNQGEAILAITEAFNRREELEKRGILP